MPWNDNANPGPWGSPPPPGGKDEPERGSGGGGGPRRPSGPGRGPGGAPPDLSDLQRRFEAWLGGLTGGGSGGGGMDIRKLAPLIGGGLVTLYALAGVIVVGPREEAVVTTFGAWTRSYGPGIGYHFPLIERSRKLDVTTLQTKSIGAGTGDGDTLMLTGDENIVDIEFAVLWQIKDVFKYAFDVRNPEENVRAGAEAAMREVIGKSNLQYAQTEGRSRIEQDTKDLLQKMLDEYGLGARISQVQLLRVDPPQEVIAAFRDVQAARADKEKLINEGNTYRNQQLPRAKGEAESIVQRAEAYKAEIVARANGDAQRFTQVYEQWAKAKDITTERLYLDTMEEVLRNVNKVLVDKNASGAGGGVVPYLPLPELKSGQPASPQPPRPPQPLPGATR